MVFCNKVNQWECHSQVASLKIFWLELALILDALYSDFYELVAERDLMDSLGQQADQSEIAKEDLEEEKEGSGDAEANKFSFGDFQILQVAL